MKFVHVKEKNLKGNELLLIPFGDFHYGSKDCDVKKIQEMISWIKKKDNVKVVLMGDLLDIGLKDSIGAGVFDNDIHPEQQITDMIEMLMPIQDKLVCMLEGNHECVSKNTEILTKDGWKPVINILKSDSVAQFDMDTKEISFDNPIELTQKYEKEIVEIEAWNTKQQVTLNHDIIFNGKKQKAKTLIGKTPSQKNMPLSGNIRQPGTELDLDEIQLLTWVIMDGTIVNYNKYLPKSKKIGIQFKLSKERKIKKLRVLLDNMDIPYTFNPATKSPTNILQPYYIRIYGDEARRINYLLGGIKAIPANWSNMNKYELDALLETIVDTDGCKVSNHINLRQVNKHNLDVVQIACLKNGINSHIKQRGKSGFVDNGQTQYVLSIFNNGTVNSKLTTKTIQYDDYVYCLEMPKGTIITRCDGKLAFTGNCRITQRTSIDITKLMANALNIPYCGSTAFIRFLVGKQNYIVFAAHGSTGSLTPAGKLNSVLKYNTYIDADLYLMGHVHELLHHTTDYFRVDLKDKMVRKDKRHYVITGHFLHYSGYAEQKSYAPGKTGVAKISLRKDKKRIYVSI